MGGKSSSKNETSNQYDYSQTTTEDYSAIQVAEGGLGLRGDKNTVQVTMTDGDAVAKMADTAAASMVAQHNTAAAALTYGEGIFKTAAAMGTNAMTFAERAGKNALDFAYSAGRPEAAALEGNQKMFMVGALALAVVLAIRARA